MTPADIEKLRALMEKATPGPWQVECHRSKMWAVADSDSVHLFGGMLWDDRPDDVEAVVAIRNAAPVLLALAERAARMAEALKDVRRSLRTIRDSAADPLVAGIAGIQVIAIYAALDEGERSAP